MDGFETFDLLSSIARESCESDQYFFHKPESVYGSIDKRKCRDWICYYFFPSKEVDLYYVYYKNLQALSAAKFVKKFDALIEKDSHLSISFANDNFNIHGQVVKFTLDPFWREDLVRLSLFTAIIRAGIDYEDESKDCLKHIQESKMQFNKSYFFRESFENLKCFVEEKKYTINPVATDYMKRRFTDGWCQVSLMLKKDVLV